ncbi:MAG: hypothetical protein ACM3VT_14270 [Solirubrobacterales bacterium]
MIVPGVSAETQCSSLATNQLVRGPRIPKGGQEQPFQRGMQALGGRDRVDVVDVPLETLLHKQLMRRSKDLLVMLLTVSFFS